MANPNPKTLVFFDNSNRVPAPYGTSKPFNKEAQDIWMGYDEETGQLCMTNYNRTEIITCYSPGGASPLTTFKISLDADQIQNGFSNPIPIPEAPDAPGFYYTMVDAFEIFTDNGEPFLNSVVSIGQQTAQNMQMEDSGNVVNFGASTDGKFKNTLNIFQYVAGQGLQVRMNDDSVGDGNGTLIIYGSFRKVAV